MLTEKTRKILSEQKKPLFTNNSRRYAGLSTRRKKAGKRYISRCEQIESVGAFLDYCNYSKGE